MTSLGKRKAGETEVTTSHGSTLFISNLPYSATSTDLQTLFSDFAPVRSAFIVKEQGTGFSKGVGYVAFSLLEDATMTFDQITKDGLKLNGRAISIQWAERKPKTRKDSTEEHPPKPRPQRIHTPKDPLAVKTVVIGGLPSPLDEKVLWKKVRKITGAEKVEWPLDDDKTTAQVLFKTSSQANDAISKLHAHVYKGSLLSATLKKRLEHLAGQPTPAGTEKSTKPQGNVPANGSRVIVRNLPFNITEQDIRTVFLPYGPIYGISIPLGSQEEGKAKTGKGFAFVHFYSVKDAKAALDGANGASMFSGMAEAMVADKQKKKKEIRLASKAKPKDTAEEGEEEPAHDTSSKRTRIIAVDWALSKDRWQEEKSKMEQDAKDQDVDMSDAEGDEGKSSSDEDESDSDGSDSHLGIHDLSSSGSDDENDGEEMSDEELMQPTLPPPETGTTIFIRNVPFSATEDDLRTLFRAFGPLRYARITMEYGSGRSRGTGFACFWDKEHADMVIQQSEAVRTETLSSLPDAEKAEREKKKNPFAMHSILTPDPSANIAKPLVLHGRTLDVVRAVTRDEATKLREEGERRREKTDKRNIYLLREGVIFPNSPAADTLLPPELAKRQASYNARKNVLRINPSLYVSLKRLSVRQIPLFVTERGLRHLASHATRHFEIEVKAGSRSGLSEDELLPTKEEEEEDENAPDPVPPPIKSRFKKKNVKQAKVVRAQDRVDAITGKGRSKGYGFIEMTTHADALRVLRWVNNNPSVHQLFRDWWKDELEDLMKAEKAKPSDDSETRLKRYQDELQSFAGAKKAGPNLIVEFSIENIQVVRRRSDVISKKREKASHETELPEPKKKKRKTETQLTDSAPVASEPPKPGASIGSIIGRKRKQKKGGK